MFRLVGVGLGGVGQLPDQVRAAQGMGGRVAVVDGQSVVQLKISGCHRSADGASNWLRVRGYISTVRKHGDDILIALRDALTGNPWKPPIPAPA